MRRQRAIGTVAARHLARIGAFATIAAALGAFAASGSLAAPQRVHHPRIGNRLVRRDLGAVARGQVIRPFGVNTNKSTNWSGYNQGSLEQGGKLFHAITGTWTVPTAIQHKTGQAEYSSDWIGIGGGCVDKGCHITDATLIQTGTEQNVSSGGTASYSAWYELVPAPSLTIKAMNVRAGDHMYASISEPIPLSNVWKIVIKDLSDNQSFTKTVPYSSTHATAEWIEETPLIIGTGGGFAALPNLTTPAFDHGTVNGTAANLKSSEQVQLVSSSGTVVADPSAPDPDTDGFNVCAWAGSCSAPSSS